MCRRRSVSFAVTTGDEESVLSPEFKGMQASGCLAPSEVRRCAPRDRLVSGASRRGMADEPRGQYSRRFDCEERGRRGMRCGDVLPETMWALSTATPMRTAFSGYAYGSFILELADGASLPEGDWEVIELGRTGGAGSFICGGEAVTLCEAKEIYENVLEGVYPVKAAADGPALRDFAFSAPARTVSAEKFAAPRVLIPVFPGTNCEFDTARALEKAGAVPGDLRNRQPDRAGGFGECAGFR